MESLLAGSYPVEKIQFKVQIWFTSLLHRIIFKCSLTFNYIITLTLNNRLIFFGNYLSFRYTRGSANLLSRAGYFSSADLLSRTNKKGQSLLHGISLSADVIFDVINSTTKKATTDQEKRERRKLRGTQRQFSENICPEDDLGSRIFGTVFVKFLAYYFLPLPHF